MPKETTEPICPFLQCETMDKINERVSQLENRIITHSLETSVHVKGIREAIKKGDPTLFEKERIEKIVREVIDEVLDEKKRMGE